MTNTTPRPNQPGRICPTCGTRLAETAARCAVCGTEFGSGAKRPVSPRIAGGSTNSLSLPVGAIILGPIFFLFAGALIMALLARTGKMPFGSTATPLPSSSSTITQTPSPTLTETVTPTSTPIPDLIITVGPNDTSCLAIAYRLDSSVNAILQNPRNKNLRADCSNLSLGMTLYIPVNTPTPPPPPTATYNSQKQTQMACTTDTYLVKDGDTLAGIAYNYNVPMEAIKEWNASINGDVVYSGLSLLIPLCRRNPTEGPSPTPTTPPPYPAPNLLTPRDGTVFALADDQIALQWAAVGTLRDNEAYQITIEDISSSSATRFVGYATDTRFLVPTSLRPTDSSVHLYRWSVSVVRQVGTTDAGKPIYIPAGATSDHRVFAWGGSGAGSTPVANTPTPSK
jgi:LysM repeat protein